MDPILDSRGSLGPPDSDDLYISCFRRLMTCAQSGGLSLCMER